VKFPIQLIGVGGDGILGLPAKTLAKIESAQHIWGSERLLRFWQDHPGIKHLINNNMSVFIEELRNVAVENSSIVLASGDPGFFGVGATLLKSFPNEQIEVIPHVSSIQVAFARAKIAWNGAHFTSVHARSMEELVGLVRRFAMIGILTSPQQSPAKIAQTLLRAHLADCRAIVGENLEEEDEKITDVRLSELPGMEFSPLNVLLLIQDKDWRPVNTVIHRADSEYLHKKGMITKTDVRALSISRLGLFETATVWDVGAGSGSLSIECSEIVWRGCVYAVEQDSEAFNLLTQNIARFGAVNVNPIYGSAPEVLEGIPEPTSVFIGGSGGKLIPILEKVAAIAQAPCKVVVNLALLEHLSETHRFMQTNGWLPQITQVNLSYGMDLAGSTRLTPINPVFIISGTLP